MRRADQVLGSSLRKSEEESEEESASLDSYNPIAGEKVLLLGFFKKDFLKEISFPTYYYFLSYNGEQRQKFVQ